MTYHNLGVTTMDQALPGSVNPPLNRSHGRNRGMVPTNIANETEVATTSDARLKELLGVDPKLYESVYGNPNAMWLEAMGLDLGSSGTGVKASDTLARDKFNYDKTQDAATQAAALEALQFGRARDARIAGKYSDYYDGGQGQYNQGFNNLLGMITAQGAFSNQGVKDAYGRAMTGIDEGYGAAQGVGDEGYRALNAYLGANPNNPYANMRAQVGSPSDAMSQYLGAYGVSDMPVQGQIQADQLQAQQGAGNFQNLIDVLSGVAQQGAGSRAAESQMAQNFFNTTLGQDRFSYRSQAENAQAQALAALQQRMFDSQFGVESDRNDFANQLVQKVIETDGDINNYDGIPDPTLKVTDPVVTAPTQTRAQKVAAAPTTYASFKEAAKVLSPKAVAKYTADGSGLSAKEVSSLKKEFPALAKVFETAKKPKNKK
jgi:hypothetical protein